MSTATLTNAERVQNIVDQIDIDYSAYEWEGITIYVRPMIGLDELIRLTNNIMNACTDKHGIFLPELLDFALRVQVLLFYTDIELPHSVEDQSKFVYGTSIYDDVVEVISNGQMESITKAVNYFASCTTGFLSELTTKPKDDAV